ncbi:MAG TPA: MFS transporter, partial [Pirellulales bacterium]|nr:MFS transporter [Pirellulales bacterium]
MSTIPAASAVAPTLDAHSLTPPAALERRHWLAALAMLFVLFTPYQTLVQTVTTDDAVRNGVEADSYDMTWVQVAYGVGVLYGVFVALWLSARIGARYTIALGLVGFALGNVLCGAAGGLVSLALGRFVDGFGKLLVMGYRPRHPLQAIRSAAAGGHRLLRGFCLRDTLLDAADHGRARRLAVVAMDVLGLC